MPSEATPEQLSAYLDDELEAPARAELEAHLKTCSRCRAQLEAIRRTVTAIRALPMETPPRTFSLPAQRRQSWSWAPVGWIGGAAAALLVVALGISQLHNLGGGSASTASQNSGGLAAAAPVVQPRVGSSAQDQAYAAKAALSGQQTTVNEPGNSGRSLTVSTDARSYLPGGAITVRVSVRGLTATEASTVRIFLSRDRYAGGYAIRLAPPTNQKTYPMAFEGSYAVSDMHLQAPQDGTYSLQVTVDLSNGSSLIAYVPVVITP